MPNQISAACNDGEPWLKDAQNIENGCTKTAVCCINFTRTHLFYFRQSLVLLSLSDYHFFIFPYKDKQYGYQV